MKKYKIKLIKTSVIAPNMHKFTFSKPAGFNYLPGQYGVFTNHRFTNTPENTNFRQFTFSSAPHQDHLEFITKSGPSKFKTELQNIKIGEILNLEGPFGDLTLGQTGKPYVFITGGIGITPFLSMINHIIHHKLPHRVHLFYMSKTKEENIYFDEFKNFSLTNDNFNFIPTLTKTPDPDEVTEFGRVNNVMLQKYLKENLNSYQFYIAGSVELVQSVKQLLEDYSVSPLNISFEGFS